VLAKVLPPELVDRVVDQAGVCAQRACALPGPGGGHYLLAMVLFFQSGYGEVWNKLVAGLDWARRFRVRLSLGMQPTPAAVTLARKRLGLAGHGTAAGAGRRAAGQAGPAGGVRVQDAAGGR
jgi:Insertion element 4 transposase N-terminal